MRRLAERQWKTRVAPAHLGLPQSVGDIAAFRRLVILEDVFRRRRTVQFHGPSPTRCPVEPERLAGRLAGAVFFLNLPPHRQIHQDQHAEIFEAAESRRIIRKKPGGSRETAPRRTSSVAFDPSPSKSLTGGAVLVQGGGIACAKAAVGTIARRAPSVSAPPAGRARPGKDSSPIAALNLLAWNPTTILRRPGNGPGMALRRTPGNGRRSGSCAI